MVTAILAMLLASRPAPPKVIAPKTSYDGSITIRFSSRKRPMRFRCALDRRKPRRCHSPFHAHLRPGRHLFRVRAIDAKGRRSRFARVSFTVVVPAPSVRVGSAPVSLCFGGGSLWTADYTGGTVTRVDPAKQWVVATIDVGGLPGGIAYGAGAVWAGNFDGTVGISKIDPATNTVLKHLHVGQQPIGLTVSGDTLWVADYAGFVDRVDTKTGALVAHISVGGQPEALALGFGLLWVTNYDGWVSAINPTTNALVGGKIPGGPDMDAITVSADAVWAGSLYGSALYRINPATRQVTRRVRLPGDASGVLAVSGSVWTSLYDSELVVKVDAASGRVVRRVRVGRQPRELAFDGSAIWVVNQASSSVSRFAP